jgi:hypothetical protein
MKFRSISVSIFVVLLLSVQSLALKDKKETLPQSCDAVWKAAIAVAKTEQYRIISASKEEQFVSVAVGGFWGGERIISLSLASDGEERCIMTVQSRFSGMAHSDAEDLMERVHVEVVAEAVGRDSVVFRKYKKCVRDSVAAKCDVKLRPLVATSTAQSQSSPSAGGVHP